jgi:hypothetical protein
VSEFFDADEAMKKVTYDRDRDALKQALVVVRENVEARGMDVVFP